MRCFGCYSSALPIPFDFQPLTALLCPAAGRNLLPTEKAFLPPAGQYRQPSPRRVCGQGGFMERSGENRESEERPTCAGD